MLNSLRTLFVKRSNNRKTRSNQNLIKFHYKQESKYFIWCFTTCNAMIISLQRFVIRLYTTYRWCVQKKATVLRDTHKYVYARNASSRARAQEGAPNWYTYNWYIIIIIARTRICRAIRCNIRYALVLLLGVDDNFFLVFSLFSIRGPYRVLLLLLL